MERYRVVLAAVAILLACTAIVLSLGADDGAGIDTAKKSQVRAQDEGDALGENPAGENLVLAPQRIENQPSENLVRAGTVGVIASSHSPESPRVDVQPAIDIPPYVPPEPYIPPGNKPELRSARDTFPASLENLHHAETISVEQASKLENLRAAENAGE